MRRRFQAIRYAALVGGLMSLVAAARTMRDCRDIAFPAMSNNAALQYWQGFGLLPALDEAQEKLLDERATAPLDDAATKLIEQSRPV